MIVYHGSDRIIQKPDISFSKKRLDFGCGFYATTVKEQAMRWAKRKAMLGNKGIGIVNVFNMQENANFIMRDFANDLDSWIDFVCQCRDGVAIYKEYDLIKGKVADDKVFRVVDMYKRGIWDKERAIREIKVYKTYDQIAFVSQEAINSMLKFVDSFEVRI